VCVCVCVCERVCVRTYTHIRTCMHMCVFVWCACVRARSGVDNIVSKLACVYVFE